MITRQEREKIGLKFASEGEFWMQLDDFVSHFSTVEICHIVNTSIFSLKTRWHEAMFRGSWQHSSKSLTDRSGGNHENPTFLSNPQVILRSDLHFGLSVSNKSANNKKFLD